MTKIIFIITFLALSSTAQARSSFLQKLLFELGFATDPSVQICPESPAIDRKATEQELWLSAEAASLKYNKCAAAALYRSLVINYPGSVHYKESYRKMIQTYIDAQDFILAINEANIYLEDNNGYNDSEYIHLLLLRALNLEIKNSTGNKARQSEFVALSLGASFTQTEDTPYLLKLQYRSFLDRYPQSLWKLEVEAMLNEARQMYGRVVLSEARMAILRKDYNTAFKKYNIIIKWGPVVGIFEEAIYEMIQYHFQLAWFLTEPYLLSDYALNNMLNRSFTQVSTSEERLKLAKMTRAQGEKYLEQLEKNLPNGEWTQKALQLRIAYPQP